ncbi:MAG: response regulator [Deltaproteobacteria bacterium]|nr:response regulator [Deltaproteobacteria bacterium]
MSKTALVVDNDFFFVEFLAELLQKRDYEVVKAYDGKEGLSKLEEMSVDIAFLDLMMPKIDGPQMIKVIRRRYPEAQFPIVAISGTLIEQMDDMDGTAADYFIIKGPLEQMSSQVEALLDRMEANGFSADDEKWLIETGDLYPRQTISELMDHLNYRKFVIESMGVGVLIVDKDAKVLEINPLAAEMAGRSLEQVLGTPVMAVFPKSERPQLIRSLKAVAQDLSLKNTRAQMTVLGKKLKALVSLLRIEEDIGGWIIVLMEDD